MKNCQAGVNLRYSQIGHILYTSHHPLPFCSKSCLVPTEAGLFSNHRIESSPLKIAKHADYIIIVAEASLHYFFHAKVTKKLIETKHFKLHSMLQSQSYYPQMFQLAHKYTMQSMVTGSPKRIQYFFWSNSAVTIFESHVLVV